MLGIYVSVYFSKSTCRGICALAVPGSLLSTGEGPIPRAGTEGFHQLGKPKASGAWGVGIRMQTCRTNVVWVA